MASEIFETSSIESFAPVYPITTIDFSDISYGNISTNSDGEKFGSPSPIYSNSTYLSDISYGNISTNSDGEKFGSLSPISTIDLSEISYGNILTDLDEEKTIDGTLNECKTNDDSNFGQTLDEEMQEFMKEFLISPKDTKPQNELNTLDNSKENLSRNAEYQLVTLNVENDESLQFIDLSQSTSSSPEAVTSPIIISLKLPTYINNTPLSSRQLRYRSLKPQVCDICDKPFRTRQHLQRHRIEKHSDDLCPKKFPYHCQQCDKRFKRREHLQVHQRTKHSSIKDYKCETCGKEFARKGHLTRHRMHHERKKTASICSDCGRVFARRGNLRNHVANGCVGIRTPGAW